MNAVEKNLLYRTLKDVRRVNKNGKIHTAHKAMSEAYSFFCFDQSVEFEDYLEQVHPWLAIRYAFPWSKDVRNGEAYWKDVNHRWEEVLIKNKLANSGILHRLTIDELKAQSRDFFKDAQCIGTAQSEAIDLFVMYAEERDERERKKKEAEEAEAKRKREAHIANFNKRKEEIANANNTQNVKNSVWTSSVIAPDADTSDDINDDDDDYVILNIEYRNKQRLGKGEMRFEMSSVNNRINMSAEDSELILKSDYKYVCIKRDCTLLFNNDSNRGILYRIKNNAININSKILVTYIAASFGIVDNKFKMNISEAVSDTNGISFKILSKV